MRMHFAGAVLAFVAVGLVGCATPPQTPIQLNAATVGQGPARIGVAMTALPKPDTSFPGAGCLLCLAAASLVNSSLTAHAGTLPQEDLPRLKEMVAELVRKRGGDVRVIDADLKLDDLPNAATQGPNLARKDFGALQKRYEVDKLVVLSIGWLGFERGYSAYIPSGDPKAVVRGVAFMVDLKSNAYEWYQPINVVRSADGAWDEPKQYPGLTNAYFQAIEVGKDEVLKPFKP